MGVSWHPAAHAIVALARIAPLTARALMAPLASSRIAWVRVYAARASGVLNDTAALRVLGRDESDNVKEAAIDQLAKIAGHSADDVYLSGLSARGYQAVRAAALALAGSPRRNEVLAAALSTARRLRADSSESSRDTRMAVLERIGEFGVPSQAAAIADLATDFDCVVAQKASDLAARFATTGRLTTSRCTRLPIRLPPDAVALALGREARLRVVMADASGGGSFIVRLRGDEAPIMAARILALARSHYYDGLTWQRVEADFVIQGGSPGANEYVGNRRYIRDELGTIPHVRGTVGMSTRGHDTGDAQWFINLRDNLRLDRDYTVFGDVVEGIEVVDDIQEGDTIARIDVLR
jgi:cyclophilin family peptidyl-prolyl cis-trans isomerase